MYLKDLITSFQDTAGNTQEKYSKADRLHVSSDTSPRGARGNTGCKGRAPGSEPGPTTPSGAPKQLAPLGLGFSHLQNGNNEPGIVGANEPAPAGEYTRSACTFLQALADQTGPTETLRSLLLPL